MQPEIIIIAAAVVAVIILIVGIVSLRSQNREIEERLGRYTEIDYIPIPQAEAVSQGEQVREAAKRMDQALAKRGVGQKWRTSLAKANLKITVVEYFFIMLGSTLVAFLLGTFIIFRDPVMGLVSAVIGFFAPRLWVSRTQRKRLHTFEYQLPDILGLWVNGLRSGYSVLQAMDAIANESPEPASEEFRRVVQEVQIGIDMEDAFQHLLNRIDSEDMDLVVTAVNVQREVGGNLAEILNVISHTVRERIKLKGEIRVLTSQGRITGWVISLLPIGLAFLLMAINPEYMGGLFNDRACGWPMLGIGLGLISLGAFAIQRIVDIDY